MKSLGKNLPPLLHPESLREPLTEVLGDFFIAAWPLEEMPVERFAVSIETAVDCLLRGMERVPLDSAPVGLITNLLARAVRHKDRVMDGSRRDPLAGYSFRLAVEGVRIGVILQVDVSSSQAITDALVYLRIAAIFSPEEFKEAKKAIAKHELEAGGLSDALKAELMPRAPEQEQTLDYDLEFEPSAPRPR
jgi:hypothetical protein